MRTLKINSHGNTTKDSRPFDWFIGQRAVFTSEWSGQRHEGTVERGDGHYPVLRTDDGRHVRLGDRIEIVEG